MLPLVALCAAMLAQALAIAVSMLSVQAAAESLAAQQAAGRQPSMEQVPLGPRVRARLHERPDGLAVTTTVPRVVPMPTLRLSRAVVQPAP